MESKEVIKSLTKALETSNILLASYCEEAGPGEKQSIIQLMICTNATAIIAASVFVEDQSISVEQVDGSLIKCFVATPIKDFGRVIILLTEAYEMVTTGRRLDSEELEEISNNLSDALILLKNENN